jgi:hypothetical protein
MKYTLIALLLWLCVWPACAEPTIQVSGKIELHDLNMAPDDALQGLPFVLETANVYYHYAGKYNGGPQGLTDALAPDTPTRDLILSGPTVMTLRWELGAVPAEGRELKTLRIFWNMDDGARNQVNFKFAVRDAATQEWRDVSAYLKVGGDDRWQEDNTYRSATLTFPAGEVRDFDALRLYDGCSLIPFYGPRWVELDAFTGPAK